MQLSWNVPPTTGNDELDAFLDDLLSQVTPLQVAGHDQIIRSGVGSPEGVIQANPGSLYLRTDGGAGTSFYVKESGTEKTGWIAK
jgi:hypothetical protein